MEFGSTREIIRNGRQSAVDKGSFEVMRKMAARIKSLEFQLKVERDKNTVLTACVASAEKG